MRIFAALAPQCAPLLGIAAIFSHVLSPRVRSTIGSILISMVDFGLHCAVGIWLTVYFFGDHQAFWLFILLALVANLIGIVTYIARK